MFNKKLQHFSMMAAVALGVTLFAQPAMAKKTCSDTSLTLEGSGTSPVEITQGDSNVPAAATVKTATSGPSSCNTTLSAANVPDNAGVIDIYAKGVKDALTNTYFTCSDNGIGSRNEFVSDAPAPTATGSYDASGLIAPTTIGVVADYSGNSDYAGSNVCIDLQVNQAPVTGCSCDGLAPDIYVFADQASAVGTAPGDYFAGSFQIRVKNCLGHDQSSVKVQGGAVAWATSSVDGSAGAVGDGETVAVSTKQKNKVFTWTTNLTAGQCKSIEIDEAGKIDAKAIPGETVYYMSGPWSAAWRYDGVSDKSDYTGRVSFTVTAP